MSTCDAIADAKLYYKVISSDGIESKVTAKAIQKLKALAPMIESLPPQTMENVDKTEGIPAGKVTSHILNIVLRWCEEHKFEPNPVDDGVPKGVVISDFDRKLLEIDNQSLFDLICAANFLNVKGLMDVASKKVVQLTEGKTAEEMLKFYGIPTNQEVEAERKKMREEEDSGEGTSEQLKSNL